MSDPQWTPLDFVEAMRGIDEAIAHAAHSVPAWRRRVFLRRARRHVARLFPAPPGGPPGPNGFGDETGVREPRRPMPTRPSAAMALPWEDSPAL